MREPPAPLSRPLRPPLPPPPSLTFTRRRPADEPTDGAATPSSAAATPSARVGRKLLSWTSRKGAAASTPRAGSAALISTRVEEEDPPPAAGARPAGWLDGAAATVRTQMPTPARDDPKPTLWGLCRGVIGKV